MLEGIVAVVVALKVVVVSLFKYPSHLSLQTNWEEGNYRVTDSPAPRGEVHVGGDQVHWGLILVILLPCYSNAHIIFFSLLAPVPLLYLLLLLHFCLLKEKVKTTISVVCLY